MPFSISRRLRRRHFQRVDAFFSSLFASDAGDYQADYPRPTFSAPSHAMPPIIAVFAAAIDTLMMPAGFLHAAFIDYAFSSAISPPLPD